MSFSELLIRDFSYKIRLSESSLDLVLKEDESDTKSQQEDAESGFEEKAGLEEAETVTEAELSESRSLEGSLENKNISEAQKVIESDEGIDEEYFPSADVPSYLTECLKYNVTPYSALDEVPFSKELDLECYPLNNVGFRVLINHLNEQSLYHIQRLILRKIPLNWESCKDLGQYIANSLDLKALDLTKCRIGLVGIQELSEAFSTNQSLQELVLNKCHLKDPAGVILFESFEGNSTLKRLELSYNRLGFLTAKTLGNFLVENEGLEYLDLSWNEFFYEKEGIGLILKSLTTNKALQSLNLSWNALQGPIFLKFLRQCLRKNFTLKSLDLSHNSIGPNDIEDLLKSLQKASALETLIFDGNPITQSDALQFLQLFSVPTCPLKKLSFGREFWHNKAFLDAAVELQTLRPDVNIAYQKTNIRRAPAPVNFKEIVMRRVKALVDKALKAKKKRRVSKKRKILNFLELLEEFLEVEGPTKMKQKDFKEVLKENKIKLPDDLVRSLMMEFPVIPEGRKRKKITEVNIVKLAYEYLRDFEPEVLRNCYKKVIQEAQKRRESERQRRASDLLERYEQEMEKIMVVKSDLKEVISFIQDMIQDFEQEGIISSGIQPEIDQEDDSDTQPKTPKEKEPQDEVQIETLPPETQDGVKDEIPHDFDQNPEETMLKVTDYGPSRV